MDRSEFKRIVTALMIEHPFYAVLLSKIRVESSSEIPAVAMTDGRRIIVNPERFARLSPKERIGVMVHELHHIIEMHPARRRELMKKYPMKPLVYNAVEDAKINQHISADFVLPSTAIMPRHIEEAFGVKGVEKKSYEEIIAEIYRGGSFAHSPAEAEADVSTEPLAGGTVVNEGSEDVVEARNDDELANAVRRMVVEAYVTAKQVGKMPAWLERLVRELTRPRIPWRRVLRAVVDSAIGADVYRTYTKPSKRVLAVDTDVDLPSKRTQGFEKVVVLVDTSGSISENELRQFVSEIYAIFRETSKEIIVIPWDATAYPPVRIRNASDIRSIKLYGGGGTMIRDALSKALALRPDVTVIFSDFAIGDINSAEVQQMLRRLASRGRLVMVTTHAEPPKIPGSVTVKLEMG